MQDTAPQNHSVESDEELIRALEILAARLHSDERIWWDEKAITSLQIVTMRLHSAGILTGEQLDDIPYL